MNCRTVKTPHGFAIVCVPRTPARRCIVCGHPASKLCDHPQGKRTCDAPLCERHAVHIAPDTDYCPDHAPRDVA